MAGPSDGKTGELYAEVEWSFGGTIPTGKFGNVRMQATIRLPALLGEIDEVFDFAVKWVDDKLTAKHEEVKSAYGIS